MLVVAPLSGHHATLLRDTVRTLLQDHKVYITDWVDARMVPAGAGAFTLDDYVHTIRDFIRHNRREGAARHQRLPADGAGAGRGVADGERGRTRAAHADDDGRPDRSAPIADAGQRSGHHEAAVVVREPRHPRSAAQLSRPRPQGVPGLPAARRLHRDEPEPPLPEPLGFLPGPGERRQRRRRRPPQVLRRIQRRARHAGRVLPRHHPHRVPAASAAAGPVGRRRRTRAGRRTSSLPR